MLWILLGVLAMMSGGFLAYRVGRARGMQTALPAPSRARALLERTIKDVRVDDIVQHGGKDWLVEGIVQYDEDGHTWRAARCMDAPEERWWVIGLERTGTATVRLMQRAAGLALTGYPPETLVQAGVTFKLAQRGTATTLVNGQFADLPGVKGVVKNLSLRCRWWRYSAAGEKTLLVEQWGEDYVALVGEVVKPEDVDLLSAS